MWNLLQSYFLVCALLGCNALSYKINIDNEYQGALSGRFYHIPLVKLLMAIFYFLSVFIILGMSVALMFKIEWYWALSALVGGYFIAFQFTPKGILGNRGSDFLFFNGGFLLITIPGSIWYFVSLYSKFIVE